MTSVASTTPHNTPPQSTFDIVDVREEPDKYSVVKLPVDASSLEHPAFKGTETKQDSTSDTTGIFNIYQWKEPVLLSIVHSESTEDERTHTDSCSGVYDRINDTNVSKNSPSATRGNLQVTGGIRSKHLAHDLSTKRENNIIRTYEMIPLNSNTDIVENVGQSKEIFDDEIYSSTSRISSSHPAEGNGLETYHQTYQVEKEKSTFTQLHDLSAMREADEYAEPTLLATKHLTQHNDSISCYSENVENPKVNIYEDL